MNPRSFVLAAVCGLSAAISGTAEAGGYYYAAPSYYAAPVYPAFAPVYAPAYAPVYAPVYRPVYAVAPVYVRPVVVAPVVVAPVVVAPVAVAPVYSAPVYVSRPVRVTETYRSGPFAENYRYHVEQPGPDYTYQYNSNWYRTRVVERFD